MQLILVDPNSVMTAAWEKEFAGLPDVEIVNGYFEKLSAFDCMVSAANSFGLMDGGVDLAISEFFGWGLQDHVQKRIIAEWRGEQPVGTCMIVETHHPQHPFIAHTPTMRTPMEIAHTDNPYKAMWAMLLAVWQHNQTAEHKINLVACPGLGTAVGRVPPAEGAYQMALAYKNFLNPPTHISWSYATARQDNIRYGGDIGLHFPPRGSQL
ncbi:MAG: macro domain-containing protein [Anaerolineales bacterium]|nr:macro domain-containing protein [Anaerolineales bacterium]